MAVGIKRFIYSHPAVGVAFVPGSVMAEPQPDLWILPHRALNGLVCPVDSGRYHLKMDMWSPGPR
jgi:hypothetical protein